MNKDMQEIIRTYSVVIIVTLFIAVVVMGVLGVRVVTALTADMHEQHTAMLEQAALIDRSSATPSVRAVVRDCNAADREQFDTLLSNLESLSPAELITIETLFLECGDYFAQTRAVMTLVLEEQLQQLRHTAQLLAAVPSAEQPSELITAWEELVVHEKERASLDMELVRSQRQIIAALRDGVAQDSEEIVRYLNEANETRESLTFVGLEIDAMREDVLSQWNSS
jgi:Na+-transporting NADH:ubiquinone oxidoreductase subunit NqrC